MNRNPPASLFAFVITLGLASQFAAGLLAAQASDPWVASGVTLSAYILILGYAVLISYRRGFESARAPKRSKDAVL